MHKWNKVVDELAQTEVVQYFISSKVSALTGLLYSYVRKDSQISPVKLYILHAFFYLIGRRSVKFS